MSALRDYAGKVAPYSPLYRLLAERGEDFGFTPLPEGEQPGRAKACYSNSTHRAIGSFGDAEDVTYYEGLCLDGHIPFAHAWVVRDGRVIDLTLRHLDGRCTFCDGLGELHPTEHWAYESPGEDEDDEFDEAETVPCEMCDATGVTEPRDRTDTTYLGVPVQADTLRRIIVRKGTYTCLDGIGFEIVCAELGFEWQREAA
jgi:hypothetical protein